MTAEKRICFGICICQMTAILSGVSLLYLSVIVIVPSKKLLELNFHRTPIMCTTITSVDIAALNTKEVCEWASCNEWCLSNDSSSCIQIQVMVRNNGSKVNFRNCVDILDENCSAYDVFSSQIYSCKKGQCKDLTGFFFCTMDYENDCRNITAAYICHSRNIDRDAITCTKEKCAERLDGTYSCRAGQCQKLKDIKNYEDDCERKCTSLEMRERNVVIFSWERMVATACRSVDSPDNITKTNIEAVNTKQEWQDKKEALFIFCSYVKKDKGSETYDIENDDCFNATLINTDETQHLTDYLDLLRIITGLPANSTNWIIPPENTLRVMNNTQLRINPGHCVNSLIKECTAFIETHAHDGKDGMTQDRYPCFYSDQDLEYVIGKFDPDTTFTMLLVTSILPGCLFVLACSCLFFCSKSVGVDDEGHLRVTLLQGGGAGASKDATQFDELL